MLTLQYLWERTNRYPRLVRRARQARVKILKDSGLILPTKGTQKQRMVFVRTSLLNKDSSGTEYYLMIHNHGTKTNPKDFKFTPHSLVWVHCSCPFFLYNLEVAIALKKSSSIIDAEVNPKTGTRYPRITNPRGETYLCKHLYATLERLMFLDQKRAEAEKRKMR